MGAPPRALYSLQVISCAHSCGGVYCEVRLVDEDVVSFFMLVAMVFVNFSFVQCVFFMSPFYTGKKGALISLELHFGFDAHRPASNASGATPPKQHHQRD
jgi:hypothetical protein